MRTASQLVGLERRRNPLMLTGGDVRDALRACAVAAAPGRAEVIYEFWVPRSNARADVAIVGGTIEGFEIKTDRDTLRRLPRQAEAYGRLFDRCNAVVAHRHADQAVEMLPQWWGLYLISQDTAPTLVRVRDAHANDGVDAETLVRLLWRDEAYAALCKLGIAPDPRIGRFGLWEQLLSLLQLDGLKVVVRHALLQRDPSRARIPSKRFAIT